MERDNFFKKKKENDNHLIQRHLSETLLPQCCHKKWLPMSPDSRGNWQKSHCHKSHVKNHNYALMQMLFGKSLVAIATINIRCVDSGVWTRWMPLVAKIVPNLTIIKILDWCSLLEVHFLCNKAFHDFIWHNLPWMN